MVALEMKGQNLLDNADTEYKQAVLRLMAQAFEIDQTQRVGEMEIVNADGTEVLCDLVLMTERKKRLPAECLS